MQEDAASASPDLHYRRAVALEQQGNVGEAAVAMAAAVALLQQLPSADMRQLYARLAAATGREGYSGLRLPEDWRCIALAASGRAILVALASGAEVVVISPGSYDLPQPVILSGRSGSASSALVGLGDVCLHCPSSHAVWVQHGHLTLVNLQLSGCGRMAAVCVSQPEESAAGLLAAMLRLQMGDDSSSGGIRARLTMINVRVHDYNEAGLLVHGAASALLQGCSFRWLRLQAIEVRQQGSLVARDTTVVDCKQGVSAYGGARRVELHSCSIHGTRNEGIMAAGSFENAATQAQAHIQPRRSYTSDTARQVTEEAEAWAKRHGQELRLVVSNTSISSCSNFGISIDSGAVASVMGCRLADCDPFCVLIKGSSKVELSGCQLVFEGRKSSRSMWAQLHKQALKTQGVRIGANYAASVRIIGNAFAGPEADAVVSEFGSTMSPTAGAAARRLGMWTKLPIVAGNSFHSRPEQLPSLESLAARLPGGVALNPDRLPPPLKPSPSLPELARPTNTFLQASWSPVGRQYYAIGNTFGFNVASGLPKDCSSASILLPGCGDIRNLLATVAASLQAADGNSSSDTGGRAAGSAGDSMQPQQRSLHFVLNDGNISMLARDAVLLHMAAELAAPADAILAVWANHALTAGQAGLLMASCKALAEQPWPDWLSAACCLDDGTDGGSTSPTQQQQPAGTAPAAVHRVAASSHSQDASAAAAPPPATAEQQIRAACAAWASCTLSLAQLLQQRDDLTRSDALRSHAVELSLSAVGSSSSSGGGGASSSSSGGSAISGSLRKEIRDCVRTGSLAVQASASGQQQSQQRLTHPNLTFLQAPDLQYTVYVSSSIFRALQMAGGGVGASAAQRLLAAVAPQVAAVAAAARSGALSIRLVPGDIMAVATAGRGSQAAFDFIDSSNVADYMSLPALLQACAPLLSSAAYGRLPLESMTSFGLAQRKQAPGTGTTPQQFVDSSLCLKLATYEALLGLRFLGGQQLPASTAAVRLEWAPCPASGGSGSSRGSLTAAKLFLELKPAFKAWATAYLEPLAPPAAAGSSTSECRRRALASPLGLVHLLGIAAPVAAPALVSALIRTSGTTGSAVDLAARLFKWELTLHAAISAGRSQSCSSFSYPACPGLSLMGHEEDPLLLALSPSPLPKGCEVPAAAVKQLLSSFSFDEERAVATLLLPASLQQAGVPAWGRDAVRAVRARRAGSGGRVQAAVSATGRSPGAGAALAPAAIHPDAGVRVALGPADDESGRSSQQLQVVLTPPAASKEGGEPEKAKKTKKGGSAAAAGAILEVSFGVALPGGTCGSGLPDAPRVLTTISRALGLMSVQVQPVADK